MNWFQYDRDLGHERVQKVNLMKKKCKNKVKKTWGLIPKIMMFLRRICDLFYPKSELTFL